jgi:hypothetical protein
VGWGEVAYFLIRQDPARCRFATKCFEGWILAVLGFGGGWVIGLGIRMGVGVSWVFGWGSRGEGFGIIYRNVYMYPR